MAGVCAGKAALVTGASSGIGRAVARRLAAEGAAVALVARRADVLEVVAREIAQAGGRAVALPADVREPEAAARAVAATLEAFGRLDILVCAAGEQAAGDVRRVPDDALENAIRSKLLGYVRFAREAAAHLPRGGAIVLVVGGAGKFPTGQGVVGAVVNAGLLAFTQGFAEALAPQGIRVVALNPGIVDTALFDRQAAALAEWESLSHEEALRRVRPANPLGGLHQPEQVAEVVAFLVSDAAARITSTSIDMGGRGRAL